MYAHLNVNAFDVGGYIDPAHPHDDKRPAVPEMAFFPDLKAAVDDLGQPDNLRAAQERLPDALLDWADVIVFHHYLDRLFGDWPRIERWLKAGSHRRVIWRTVGQSVDGNEATAAPFRRRGLQIVRYSPKERNIPNFAGEDALIRFYKDPAEWTGWTGQWEQVGNVTQELRGRHPYTNYGFWQAATEGLPTLPSGPGSDTIGGTGTLPYERMREYLRQIRVYLYTGTQPASYTHGLIEAMMTGVPVVSIGPSWMRIFPYGPQLFEGQDLTPETSGLQVTPWDEAADAMATHTLLRVMLNRLEYSQSVSERQRQRAIDLFGKATIAAQWARFLGIPVREMVAA